MSVCSVVAAMDPSSWVEQQLVPTLVARGSFGNKNRRRIFSKISRENSILFKNLTKLTATSNEDQYIFFIITLSFLLRMRNVSDTIYRENQNTYIMFNNSFFSNQLEITWKNFV